MLPTIQLEALPPLEFLLRDGTSLIVPPATRGQLDRAEALALPLVEQAEDAALSATRRAQMLIILIGPRAMVIRHRDGAQVESEEDTAPILASLTFTEELRVFTAIINHAHGQDAAQAIAVHDIAILQMYLNAERTC